MVTIWRWDQGREQYWKYQKIRGLAMALTKFDGVRLQRPDPLKSLPKLTGLNFKIPPNKPSYTIWRQYARVFHSALLAAKIDSRLTATDLAKALAAPDPLPMDEYLSIFATRFSCPFPGFGGSYDPASKQVFPICALVRYLIAQFKVYRQASINVEEVFSILIGNSCVGNEPIEFYQGLAPTDFAPPDDVRARQVREMLRCFGQLSFLFWDGERMHFGTASLVRDVLSALYKAFEPLKRTRLVDPELELLELGRLGSQNVMQLPKALELPLNEDDITFLEGRKSRATHLITERNPRLRDLVIRRLLASRSSILCDMCAADLDWRYPWTKNLIEIHHLLPLSSPPEVGIKGTSIKDLVAICPNCHRAVHCYYGIWLRDKGQFEFDNRSQARLVYEESKSAIQLGGRA